MAEALPQLVWVNRADGTPDWYNRRWYEFTGMPSHEGRPLDTSPYDWTEYVHPEHRERAASAWRDAVERTGRYQVEYRLRAAASATHRRVLVRGQPLRDPSGAIVQWVGTCTDIEEQRRAGASASASRSASTWRGGRAAP